MIIADGPKAHLSGLGLRALAVPGRDRLVVGHGLELRLRGTERRGGAEALHEARREARGHRGEGHAHRVALVYLRESGRATQQKLAETMMMDANNCVILLNGLEDEGLIARTRDPEDRRRHIVEITPKGYKALEKAEQELETLEDEVLGKLDPVPWQNRPNRADCLTGDRGISRVHGDLELVDVLSRLREISVAEI